MTGISAGTLSSERDTESNVHRLLGSYRKTAQWACLYTSIDAASKSIGPAAPSAKRFGRSKVEKISVGWRAQGRKSGARVGLDWVKEWREDWVNEWWEGCDEESRELAL